MQIIQNHRLAPAMAAAIVALGTIGADTHAQFVEAEVEIIHQFNGANAGDNLGSQVCAVADYNNDGAMEFLVAVQGDDTGNINAGVVHLHDGMTGAIIRSHYGTRTNEGRGYVCDAGDVNNDGITDYLFGTNDNHVYVHSGADGALLYDLLGNNESFGFRACGIGDVTGDGHGEILVGAWSNSISGTNRGRAYLYSGADGSLLRTHTGVFANAWFGHTVSVLGDLDGDGWPDYSVGAPGPWTTQIRGQVHLYSGATGQSIHSTLFPHTTGIAFSGWQQCQGGYDMNGDDVPDFTVCDIGDFQFGNSAGKLYFFDGATGDELLAIGGFSSLSGFGGTPWTPAGFIGDVDGDCIPDILVASWRSQVGATEGGQAHLLSGATRDILRTFTSSHPFAYLAGTLAGVGDCNGDGIGDFLLAANGDNGNRGAVYVVAGVDHAPTPGDLDHNGEVNVTDLLELLSNWGQDPFDVRGDLDCDGVINVTDLLILLAHWG